MNEVIWPNNKIIRNFSGIKVPFHRAISFRAPLNWTVIDERCEMYMQKPFYDQSVIAALDKDARAKFVIGLSTVEDFLLGFNGRKDKPYRDYVPTKRDMQALLSLAYHTLNEQGAMEDEDREYAREGRATLQQAAKVLEAGKILPFSLALIEEIKQLGDKIKQTQLQKPQEQLRR